MRLLTNEIHLNLTFRLLYEILPQNYQQWNSYVPKESSDAIFNCIGRRYFYKPRYGAYSFVSIYFFLQWLFFPYSASCLRIFCHNYCDMCPSVVLQCQFHVSFPNLVCQPLGAYFRFLHKPVNKYYHKIMCVDVLLFSLTQSITEVKMRLLLCSVPESSAKR